MRYDTKQMCAMNSYYGKAALALVLLMLLAGRSLAAVPDKSHTYYPSGNLHTKLILENDDNNTPHDPLDDSPAGTIYVYDDTRLYLSIMNFGHLIRHIRPDYSYRTFEDYYDEEHPRFVKEYSPTGELIVAYEHSPTGHLIKRTNPDGSYAKFDEYFNKGYARFLKKYDTKGALISAQEYSASPYRLIKETYATANANCEIYYTYSWDDSTRIVTKRSYTNASGEDRFFFAKYQLNYYEFENYSPQKFDPPPLQLGDALVCKPTKQATKGRKNLPFLAK